MKASPRPTTNALLLCSSLVLIAATLSLGDMSNVAMTKHNLTATGPGTVRTDSGGEPCIFCHTPHAARPQTPLWNRNDSGVYYQTYESSTLKADVGQPSGASRLCLSCHDGTIALTDTYNPSVKPSGGAVFISQGDRGYLGTDLSDDHPISFVYDAALANEQGELAYPSTLPAQLPLDQNGRLQCTTCHDPHDDSKGKFLRMDNTASAMCVACHTIGEWSVSVHANATASLALSQRDEWDNINPGTVANAGCESCHRPHSAGGRQRLLRHEAEESNCFNCHDGSVASANIAAAVNRISSHPVGRTTGVHDPNENVALMREHVECSDCHSPHRTLPASNSATAPLIKPTMNGAPGVTRTGTPVRQARYEYEVCYRCHSSRNFASPVVSRDQGLNNIADEFSPNNQSFHPVETTSRSSRTPSLKAPYTSQSMLYCTDCHGSDDAATSGPHGSSHRPLLTDRYEYRDGFNESQQNYALCYRCHSRNSILNDESFRKHKEHIDGEQTSCATCHDPHGVENRTHLINFDTRVVGPSRSSGQGPSFTDLGDRRGSCTLYCHGEDHNDERY